MTSWPKDDEEHRNAFYGDPARGQIDAQLVDVVPPFRMTYTDEHGTSVIKKIRFHKKCADALRAALNEIWEYCQHDQAKVDASGASKFFGAYAHRMVRGSKTKWSNHAYGAAIDLNALENALGDKHGTMPQFIVDAFCRQGAMWGGWYKSRPDFMHFEFVDNGGRVPQSAPPARGGVAAPVTAPVSAAVVPSADRRTRMGRVILSFEARRDAQGRLAVYKLPANDGGGTYEVAGINDRYHPEQASHLRDLIAAKKFDEAEAAAVEYMVKYTDAAAAWTTSAGVEFFLRDCIFNCGPTGAAKILQLALDVAVDGAIGVKTREALSRAEPGPLLDRLRVARERYEDMTKPGRPNLRAGLINRWNNALAEAKKFAAETPTSSQRNAADAGKLLSVAAASSGVGMVGIKQGWGPIEWLAAAGVVIMLIAIAIAVVHWWRRRSQPAPAPVAQAAPAALEQPAPAAPARPARRPAKRKKPAKRRARRKAA